MYVCCTDACPRALPAVLETGPSHGRGAQRYCLVLRAYSIQRARFVDPLYSVQSLPPPPNAQPAARDWLQALHTPAYQSASLGGMRQLDVKTWWHELRQLLLIKVLLEPVVVDLDASKLLNLGGGESRAVRCSSGRRVGDRRLRKRPATCGRGAKGRLHNRCGGSAGRVVRDGETVRHGLLQEARRRGGE